MTNPLVTRNLRLARVRWNQMIGRAGRTLLKNLTLQYRFSIADGDLIWLDRSWYATHSGLLRLARRARCAGIHAKPIHDFCNPGSQRWAFEATVFKTRSCRGFVGHGDADPSNVSDLVRGAEMRVAETRAVNRALRKAYGVGICSIEEVGALSEPSQHSARPPRISSPPSDPSQSERSVRNQLLQVIRHHNLDPILVRAYAVDFCGAKELKDAEREQIENFVKELSDRAEKDRTALIRQLNSYVVPNEEAA